MATTSLRKVGGSVMMSVPRAFLDQMDLSVGSTVDIGLKPGRMVVKPAKPKYSLEELLAQCDFSQEISHEELEWMDSSAIGQEVI